MATNGKNEKELWTALDRLDDDLLDVDLPSEVLVEELKSLGLDASALAKRGIDFVERTKEEQRLAWQTRAKERRAELETRASQATVATDMDRAAILKRLEELRATDPVVGTAIKMAARKRRAEESTDDELRSLLEQMEALRAMEGKGSE